MFGGLYHTQPVAMFPYLLFSLSIQARAINNVPTWHVSTVRMLHAREFRRAFRTSTKRAFALFLEVERRPTTKGT